MHFIWREFVLALEPDAADFLNLRRRVVAGHAIVNVAFLGLTEIEDAASTLAVNEGGGFGVGVFPFCFGLPVLPFKEHVFGAAVCLS
jgi:hypothetical protein